jgi:hypothetical protein
VGIEGAAGVKSVSIMLNFLSVGFWCDVNL